MGLMAVFLVYYLYRSLGQLIPFAFTQPDLWETHWLVKGDVTIPMWLRLAYFAVWMISITATAVMLLAALYLVNLIRTGTYFELRTIRALQRVGLCAVIAGLAIIFASSLWAWMVTLMNVSDTRSIRFVYDSSEAGVALLGLGMFLLGWILKYVLLMQRENEAMV